MRDWRGYDAPRSIERCAYTPLGALDGGSGAAVARTKLGHKPEHYTMFYVDVEDVKAALDKATELGGKTLVGPIAIPTGTFAWFADPDGNAIGLLKQAKP
jgi:predicted enzyme related to lactoylglutathione lyase